MDSASRGHRKSSLTQSRSSVSRRSATHPSEPRVNQLNQSGSGSLVKRRTLSESAKSSGVCAKSSSSGSTVKPRSTRSFSRTDSEPLVKQLQSQSASSEPHAKSVNESSVNRRRTQSASTGTRSRPLSVNRRASTGTCSRLTGNSEIHEVQVDGEQSGATSGRRVEVLDGVRFATEKV